MKCSETQYKKDYEIKMRNKKYKHGKYDNSSFVQGLVSCVSPVWNGEKWLPNLLNSLLAQTYPNMEIILSDDGSEDGTVALAETYRERFEKKGYSYIILKNDHCCAAAAVSAGLKEVTGEYIIWPDADDVLEPEAVEKRVRIMNSLSQQGEEEPSAVRSLSYYFLNTTGEKTGADEKRGNLKDTHLFFPILESATFVCCGCYMLRSNLLFEIYPERSIPVYNVGQNFQMLLPYMYRHECITLEEELYGVCVHEGSHSRRTLTKKQKLKKYRDYEKLLDDIVHAADIKDKSDRRRITLWKLHRRTAIAREYNLFFMRAWAKFRKLILGVNN